MRQLLLVSSLFITGCATTSTATSPATATAKTNPQPTAQPASCQGEVTLPASWQSIFTAVTDPTAAEQALLANAIGEPTKGKLCQGQVFTVNASAPAALYRAWNSTNPRSRLGSWWAMSAPEGAVAQYREDYEICYQWSALDKLVQCQLQPGTQVVIGTGQSAECSQYLTYPTSASLQVYIEGSDTVMGSCQDFTGVFNWLPTAP